MSPRRRTLTPEQQLRDAAVHYAGFCFAADPQSKAAVRDAEAILRVAARAFVAAESSDYAEAVS